MCDYKKIVLLSDGTGQTAKRLMDAVLAQYDHEDVEYSLEDTFQNVRDKISFDNILDNINDDYLVIFSIISENLSKYIHNKLHDRNILHLNVLQPMITTMSKFSLSISRGSCILSMTVITKKLMLSAIRLSMMMAGELIFKKQTLYYLDRREHVKLP